jgi:uncharacterized short protein YbdD (DUF466 family)
VIADFWQQLRHAGYAVADLFGEHDYARYLADWEARHAHGPTEERPMSAREFFDWRLEQKYGGGAPRRCC